MMAAWIVLLLIGAAFVFVVLSLFQQGKITVEPKGRERLVVRDLAGNLSIYPKGDHFLPPWRTEFIRVSINREPVSIPAERGMPGEEVKTSNGVMLLVEYRYDIIAGRPFDEDHGNVTVPPNDLDNENSVEDELIVSAVTKIDWPKHEEQIQQRVSAQLEQVFAKYTDRELILPGDKPHPKIPMQSEEAWVFEVVDVAKQQKDGGAPKIFEPETRHRVKTAAELYRNLSKLIELRVNRYELITIGVNVISFRITNLRYKDPEMQTSVEMKARMRNVRDGMKNAGVESEMSDVELLASTRPGELGQTVLGKGIADAGLSIGKGLENWGRGRKRPRRRKP